MTNNLKPLSSLRYFLNNKRRTFSMALAIAVSVLTVLIFQIVFYAVTESSRLSTIGLQQNMSLLVPPESGIISSSVLDSIKNEDALKLMIPVKERSTDYYHVFGNLFVPIFYIQKHDLQNVMEGLNLTLKEGRLPVTGKNEIILDELTLRNKGKKLGDYIGHELDNNERLSGKFKVVGVLKCNCFIGLGVTGENQKLSESLIMLIPQNDKINELNKLLNKIPKKAAKIHTKETEEKWFNENLNLTKTAYSVIAVVIIFIMCFAAANASYAQYESRKFEFGTLLSLGYTRLNILLRAASEIILVNIAGFLFGIFSVLLAAMALKLLIYDPKGYPFVLMETNGFFKALIIPICTTIASLIPAWWTLSKADQIEIIDIFE